MYVLYRWIIVLWKENLAYPGQELIMQRIRTATLGKIEGQRIPLRDGDGNRAIRSRMTKGGKLIRTSGIPVKNPVKSIIGRGTAL